MIPLPLRHESRERLEFAHSPGGGWGVAVLGALLYGGLLVLADGDWRLLWTFEGGALFGSFVSSALFAAGLFAALWRHRLTVDLRRREWQRQRGLWFAIRHSRGSLDDSCHLVLGQLAGHPQEASASGKYRLHLELGRGSPVHLGTYELVHQAKDQMAEMAVRLRLPATDRSGRVERRFRWQDLAPPE